MITSSSKALTFGDVSLVPSHSAVLPSEVDIKINFAEKLTLNCPIFSAAMDTVTTAPLAIAMAQAGGLGVIHKNLSIAEQAAEVFRVKKYEAGIISRPVTIGPEQKIKDARLLVEQQGVSGFPVVDREGRLVGMLTDRDLRFSENEECFVSDIMSRNLIVARPGTDKNKCLDLMREKRVEKLPLIDDDKRLVGLVTVKDIKKESSLPNSVRDDKGRLKCAAAIGCKPDLEERAHALVDAGVDALVVDAAHGHTESIKKVIMQCRSWFKDILIIAGNVVTAEGAIFLYQAGADVVKVGVGPGSICTTRIVAGVGIPQLSAIFEVGKAAKKMGFHVIADGGLQFSGDITKALAAGAHAVMTGSLLAGAKEAPGEQIIFRGRQFKVYRGMGSLGAMNQGSSDRYQQADVREPKKLVPEGIEGRIPYRGSVIEIVYQLMGGLRAGMGYMGAANLQELREKARFVELSPAGQRESHVHDVTITKEAPNYFFQD